MTVFNPKDIILIPFPFSHLSGAKNRPALCSRKRRISMHDVNVGPQGGNWVKDWQSTRLLKATAAKIGPIFTGGRHSSTGRAAGSKPAG